MSAARLAVVFACIFAGGAAQAQYVEGTGRITLTGGWRYTPNDHFLRSARNAGLEGTPSLGGPQLTGTFAYAATGGLEVAIDLFGGTERIELQGADAVSSTTYGALVGARGFWPIGRLVPNLGLALGPALVYTAGGPEQESAERLITCYAATAGLLFRTSDTFALSLDVRLLLGRGWVPGISGINGGGVWAGIGAAWLIPGEPSRRGAIR